MRDHRKHGSLIELLKANPTKNCEKIFLSKRQLKRVLTTRWNGKHASYITLDTCFE